MKESMEQVTLETLMGELKCRLKDMNADAGEADCTLAALSRLYDSSRGE